MIFRYVELLICCVILRYLEVSVWSILCIDMWYISHRCVMLGTLLWMKCSCPIPVTQGTGTSTTSKGNQWAFLAVSWSVSGSFAFVTCCFACLSWMILIYHLRLWYHLFSWYIPLSWYMWRGMISWCRAFLNIYPRYTYNLIFFGNIRIVPTLVTSRVG